MSGVAGGGPRETGDVDRVSGAAPAVALHGLRYGYEDDVAVLDIAHFEVERGQRVIVFGPSGGGKSTLLGLMAGVIKAAPGQVTVLGEDLGRLSGPERDRFRGAHVGYIFQMFNLIPYLGVADNIALPCRLNAARRSRLGERTLESAVADISERLGIGELLVRSVTRLSVGQQQRVAAARALIGAPEVVLADEPTSALDVDHRQRFLELLFESCSAVGSTLVFVSHDRTLAPLFDRDVSLTDINAVAMRP